MSDILKKSLINISGCHLGNFLDDDWNKDIIGLEELEKFLESDTFLTLYASVEHQNLNKKLKFFRSIQQQNFERIVIFSKHKSCVITEENVLSSIQVSSLSGPPTLALYHSLNNVYTPLLEKDQQLIVQKHFRKLQEDLRPTEVSDDVLTEYGSVDPHSLLAISTLEHEVEYWNSSVSSTPTSKWQKLNKVASASFRDILMPLSRDFCLIDVLPLTEVEDLMERAHSTLDDLWRHEPPFPKDRIKHLMDIIAREVYVYITKQIQNCNIWDGEYNEVNERLHQLIDIGEKWISTCKELTEIFWPNCSTNIWKEVPYQPQDLTIFVQTLHEVCGIKNIHKQLIRLLTPEEQENLNTKDMFSPFKEINIFEYGQHNNNSLLKAKKQFGYLLEPAEKHVAIKLKTQLSTVNANSRQLLYEFSRYSDIINRPIVKKSLLAERKFLLTSLNEYIHKLHSPSTLEIHQFSSGNEISNIVKEMIVVKQQEAKAREIQKVLEKNLDDLEGYEKVKQEVNELIHYVKGQQNELFEAWSRELIALINDNTLSLKVSDPVVQFSKEKFMKVNYSPRLVILIKEVRQLRTIGYHIPNIIEQTSAHAKNFMKYARILEQVANFHNTIGDRMILSQKPLMLASALKLSKLVQEEKVVSWGDEKSVEKYVNLLKNAVEKLSRENNILTTYHTQIMEKVSELEDVDLIKDYSKWKENIKYIKNIIKQVEEKGFKNMQLWKSDIDKNICQILEKQYIKSLDTLHLYLPEIYVDLIYRNGFLDFMPNETSLKKMYDQQLKKFLEIPKHFRGISDECSLYGDIIDKNSEALSSVTKHTDELFEQMQGVKKHWQSWIQIEPLDTNKLSSWQHWDLHFRASKIFGQEIAKLPSTEERVGCFLIGLSRLRSDLESHNRSYWDQLVCSLKESIVQDVIKLQTFVDSSTTVLTKHPATVEELGESGIFHANILKELPSMQEVFDDMIIKSQTLSNWSREQVESVNRLKGAWERLLSLLESHHLIMEKQMESIKITFNIEKENLTKEVERFQAKWSQVGNGEFSDSTIEDLANQMAVRITKQDEWKQILERNEKLRNDCEKFNIEMQDIFLIKGLENDLSEEQSIWDFFQEFYTEFESVLGEYWIVIRKKTYIIEDFLSKWENILKDNETNLAKCILKELAKYKNIIPLLKYVRGDDFTDKHWADVFDILGMPYKPTDQLMLKDFLNISDKIEANLQQLQSIAKKAASEIIVRQALLELDQWDIESRFTLFVHVDSKNKEHLLIKDFKDILNKIGDNQSLLQSVKNSSDYESFVEKATIWENKLTDLDYYLTSLAQIQRKWIYLEPIFSSGTLIQENSRFDRIDRDFHQILQFIDKNSRVTALCRYTNLRSILETIIDQLTRCQNSLDNFLTEKRNRFPRFLFLSDDDLLEVVGQSSKEQVIQTHLKKLFAGINSIELDDGLENIVAICSLQGEVVKLVNPVHIKRPVEEWLNVLVKEMHITLKEMLILCQSEKQSPDPFKYPSQILCLSDSITFSLKCEQAITSMTLPPLLAKYKAQLNHYSSLELESIDDTVLENDSGNDSNATLLDHKLKAILLDTIHHINVLEELILSNTTKVTDWTWQKQLRYYSNSMGEVTVKMVNARIEYSFEYLGNATKLVRTPLTDKCFLTLTQGMYLGMGGNPYGPAGTGKTESVKALGQLLGRQVLVFNCDEGVDAVSMGRIISGLVQSGAWGCFDEFNRLDEATLSAVSMLIQPVQAALRNNLKTVNILEKEIDVNKHCGIFVTLNPAGGKYGGRNKLPDNLKQLFRPIVMTLPDYELIASSLLHCDGYQNAPLIAKKIVQVFDLSSNLLSKQQHYDWGLRAIRTILTGCGKALKTYKLKHKKLNEPLLANTEFKIVVQVIRMDTLSKLTFTDSSKFDSIIQDVFKEVELHKTENELLWKMLEKTYEDFGLIVNERQINRCLELYEQLKQRMGVAIVGPPSCGKSTIRKLLLHALVKLKHNLKEYAFNPKSMKRSQLLGYMDNDTKQWIDGILTSYSLQVVSNGQDIWSWMVCDGDIDPDWIESLNSVLDDNKLLTLPSGWRIQFGQNVNFIFETHNLDYASPATISRMGIIFLSEEDLELNFIVDKFVNTLNSENKAVIEPLVQDYFIKSVNWIVSEGKITLPCSKVAIANTGLSFLSEVQNRTQFLISLTNGLGQQLQLNYKELFVKKVFEWFGEPEPPIPSRCKYDKARDIIETYYTNPNITLNDISAGLPLIETGQILQALDLLKIWFTTGKERNFLIVGPHGTAKTLLVKKLISDRSDMDLITINCGSDVQPEYVITKLFQHCLLVNTHKGKVLKPRKGNLVLFFRNLHLLKLDKWNTNILIEFINQVRVYKGFYDTNIEFIGVENTLIVGSLLNSNNLSTRFISNLCYYNISLAEKEDIMLIINTYLSAVLKVILPEKFWSKAQTSKICELMIEIYEKVKKSFLPSQCKHYVYSPHDLTNWCANLLRYKFSSNTAELENELYEIICYEALKIFGDRLVTPVERLKLENIVNESYQLLLGKPNIIAKVTNSFYVPEINISGNSPNLNLLKLNKEEWYKVMEQGIVLYEREGGQMNILINDELLNMTSSVAKFLSFTGGNIVLIGKPGIGRKTSVKITAALLSVKLIIPTHSSNPQFQNDLKMAMQVAGLEGEPIYLLLEDHILSSENNVDHINMLLSSGEVPGLYIPAEIDSLVKTLKDESDRLNYEGSLIEFFTERVKNNLHVVVCLDADNDNLWNVFQNCPALVQNCQIIWRNNWSKESIHKVSLCLIEMSNKDVEENSKITYNENFLKIYDSVVDKEPSPSRFLIMTKLYIFIYKEKLATILKRKNKLKAGVSKLNDAKNVVSELKVKADEQQKKLTEKQTKANMALDMISNTMKNASNQKELMEELREKTENENEQLLKRKKEIEEELSEVEPLVQEARAAVGNIKTEALSEIRSLRAPPEIIRDILEGVLRLMGIQDTSWNSMKIFLAKRGVKEEIRSFDAGKITTENRQAVERLIGSKSESFDSKTAKRASVAAAPLASWVTANVKYSHVMDKIRPLEKEQNKLKKNLVDAELQLNQLSSGLSDVDATVTKLKEQLSVYTKEGAEIEIDLNKAQDRLTAAEGLVVKLNDEYERWQSQLKELSIQLDFLPNNCLLSASFVTYLSKEPETERIQILSKWKEQLQNKDFDFELFLSSEREQLQWQSEGLSTDTISTQNAISILHDKMVPLLIDPTSTAFNWIKSIFKKQNIECCNNNNPKFNTVVELAIRFGKTLIIEEVETIPAVLYPILRSENFYQGERSLMKFNGKLIDYHSEFKLIFCSRNEQLKLPAELLPLINIFNFSVTHAGLTEQLLFGATQQENPGLEDRRKQLLKKREELQEKQSQYQDQLLEELASSTGDILQNKNLLSSLNETKISSTAINNALLESAEVQKKLQTEYDTFRDISYFGSTCYFACNELAENNALYVISVAAFAKLFLKSLETFQLENKFQLKKKHILQNVYNYMSRGMFKQDRLKFLIYLTHKLFVKDISEEEWNCFLKNGVSNERPNADNFPPWIPKHAISYIQNLHEFLPQFLNNLGLDNNSLWYNFINVDDCENNFPTSINLTEFQKILIVQSFRPDRLYTVMVNCILKISGLESLDPPSFKLSDIFKESTSLEPILLLSISGTDPSVEVKNLAQQLVGEGKYTEVAMGEGQELNTIKVLFQAAEAGHWLILKNLHLATKWLPVLNQNLKIIKSHNNFRLWLISEPSQNFNTVLTQNSLKIVYESPHGIKNNLQHSFTSFDSKYLDSLNPTAGRIFFVLCCFHALLQERRKYIPQGWSKMYEFTDSDLSTCVKLIEDLWNSTSFKIQWQFIHGLCLETIYSGRIESVDDMKVLEAYGNIYFVDEVLSHNWKPLGLNINLPYNNKFSDYISTILKFPIKNLPSYFGLPDNIEKAWEKQNSSMVIANLKGLHLNKRISSNFEKEHLQKSITPFLDLWKKLNQGNDFLRMTVEQNASRSTAVETFINDEFVFSLNLVHHIHKCFSNLNKILKGSVIPEAKDISLSSSLLNDETPAMWIQIWSGPQEPSQYIKNVIRNMENLFQLKQKGASLNILENSIYLALFFNPKAFLVSYKQDYSRFSNIPIDQLILECSWKKENGDVVLSNLLIEGAVLENAKLKKCQFNSENIQIAPNCYLRWKVKNTQEDENYLQVPLYSLSNRENRITYLYVFCDNKEKNQWILSGLAFFLEI